MMFIKAIPLQNSLHLKKLSIELASPTISPDGKLVLFGASMTVYGVDARTGAPTAQAAAHRGAAESRRCWRRTRWR